MFYQKSGWGFLLTSCFAGLGFWIVQSNTTAPTNLKDRTPQGSRECQREVIGGELGEAKNLFSSNGVLNLKLSYRQVKDSDDTHYCFIAADGSQSPTLHLKPGEILNITLTNNTPVPQRIDGKKDDVILLPGGKGCGVAKHIDASSTNIHFHGTNTPPTCGSDEVINTVINSGESFTYSLQIPTDEPAGIYFYHPHIHGKAEEAVWGGATGIIVVDGIQNSFPELAGIPQRILTLRDSEGLSEDKANEAKSKQNISADLEVPSFEVSLNYHPVLFPLYKTPTLTVKPESKELWRFANTSADAIVDLRLVYDGVEQEFDVVALDGVPTGSLGGKREDRRLKRKSVLLGPGNRVEFVVTTPSSRVQSAVLKTAKYVTGPDADIDPERPLMNIKVSEAAREPQLKVGAVYAEKKVHRFKYFWRKIQNALLGKERTLYFDQKDIQDPNDATKTDTEFYVTVKGHENKAFNMQRTADITTYEGALEEWTIENHAEEAHVFHIHQIHFLLLQKDGVKVSDDEKQIYDTIVIPAYDGKKDAAGNPIYPSVRVRMDFHETKPGTFVYHCHILEHEDKGMMGVIQVLPRPQPTNGEMGG